MYCQVWSEIVFQADMFWVRKIIINVRTLVIRQRRKERRAMGGTGGMIDRLVEYVVFEVKDISYS